MSVALQWYTRVILMHDVVVLIGARIVVVAQLQNVSCPAFSRIVRRRASSCEFANQASARCKMPSDQHKIGVVAVTFTR